MKVLVTCLSTLRYAVKIFILENTLKKIKNTRFLYG